MPVTPAPSPTPSAIICRHASALPYAIGEIPADPAVANASGTVVVTVLVSLDASGKPTAVSVQQTSGNAAMDRAAKMAAMESTYAPKLRPVRRLPDVAGALATPVPDGVTCGVPIPSTYIYRVTFVPNG